MENNKKYPFSRNRYYAGKLLSSADFISEQEYFNTKRNFLSRITYDYGILCGMTVTAADTFSILIESGAALDIQGREIIIDRDIIKRVSVIDGFEELKSEQLTLCVCYEEKPERPTHVIAKDDAAADMECNVISEGYRLFLLDREDALENEDLVDSIIGETLLFEDEDFKVSLNIPKVVSKLCSAQITAVLEKKSSVMKKLKFHCELQTPALVTDDGQREVTITFEDGTLEKGEKITRQFGFRVEGSNATMTTLRIKEETVTIAVNGVRQSDPNELMFMVEISDKVPADIIEDYARGISLEKYFEKMTPDYIRIADIDVSRAKDTCIIEKITRPSKLKVVHTTAQNTMIKDALEYYGAGEGQRKPYMDESLREDEKTKKEVKDYRKSGDMNFSTGTCEVPIGMSGKAGAVFFSDEIMHKLGKGDVNVQLGYEFVENDGLRGIFSQKAIYGDMEIFNNSAYDIPKFRSAVMTNYHNGTFVVGLKLLESTDAIMINVRWFAFKAPDSDKSIAAGEAKNRQIIAKPSTVTLRPKESIFIDVEFKNMDPMSYRYDLLEGESGEITSDGIYTAPAKEGVFEIHVSCIDNSNIYTYAYAVVKKKGADEE